MRSIYALPFLAILLLAGCAQQQGGGVPRAATDKYGELAEEYSDGLGAILNKCVKDGQIIYSVIGSRGFSGKTYHYDSSGKLLAAYEWDDMVEPGEPTPPVNPEGYDCAAVNESKKS